MKILLAVDGSETSKAAVDEVTRRTWPAGSEVRVLSVAHPFPYIPTLDPGFVAPAAHFDSAEVERKRAERDADQAAREIREKTADLQVESESLQGSPKKEIVEEAERWGADLIILGSHGYGPLKRFLLGSVAQAVVSHAPCSVEVVRASRN